MSEDLIKKRMEEISSLTLEYQLGWYVGESIVPSLECLDIDPIPNERITYISSEEKDHYIGLYNSWSSKTNENESSHEEWNALMEYVDEMVDKYLPSEQEYLVRAVNVTDEMGFKEGIADSLYNSDVCHFDCDGPDDIEVYLHPEAIGTVIKLKRTKK
jgi:hypothetical protein